MGKTLFSIWQEHTRKGTCDPKFTNWCSFRAWCIKNKKSVADFENVKILQAEAANVPDKPVKNKKVENKGKSATNTTTAANTEEGAK